MSFPKWGIITFVDTLGKREDRRIWGLYQKLNGLHRITIARDSPNIEKILIHEWLHSEGWRHRTKDERKRFGEKMADYGLFEVKCGR